MMAQSDVSRADIGIGWISVTGILFVAVTAVVKFMGPMMPAIQAAFLRYALALILLVPLLSWHKKMSLQKSHWWLSIAQGVRLLPQWVFGFLPWPDIQSQMLLR